MDKLFIKMLETEIKKMSVRLQETVEKRDKFGDENSVEFIRLTQESLRILNAKTTMIQALQAYKKASKN